MIGFTIIKSCESMLNFLDSLCGCFSPEIKKNIIDYLSSSKLNQNVIEEEKKNEEMEAPE